MAETNQSDTKKLARPKTSEMVNNAIKELEERGGSSLQAIKKHITVKYKVDAEKLAPFIKKYLKAAVSDGALIQTKGQGANGSFKLAAAKKETKNTAAKKTKSIVVKQPKENLTAHNDKEKPAKKSSTAKSTIVNKKTAPKIKLVAAKTKKRVAATTTGENGEIEKKKTRNGTSPTKIPKASKSKKVGKNTENN